MDANLNHWSVTVAVDGDDVLTISHNHLAGKDGLDDLAPAIRTAAAHLLCFIGAGKDIVGGNVALAPSDAAQAPANLIDRLKYFLSAWGMNGVGSTVAKVQDSPDTVATLTVNDLSTLLSAIEPDAPVAPAAAPSEWQSGTPPVPEGKCWEFIIAVRRAQSKPPGKVAVFSANYANNFTQDGELSDRDGEEFIADGWYVCGLDMSGEYNEIYEPIGLNEGDEIVGWQELPKWNDAAAADVSQGAAQ